MRLGIVPAASGHLQCQLKLLLFSEPVQKIVTELISILDLVLYLSAVVQYPFLCSG